MRTSVAPVFSAAAGTTMWSCGNVAVTGAPFTITLVTFLAPGAKSSTSGCAASLNWNRAVMVPVSGCFWSRGTFSDSS